MSQRLTFALVKGPVARAIGKCANDQETLDITNEAQERLMNHPIKAVGTVVRYRICINAVCLTWPRHIAAIEAYSLCGWPGKIRNGWYEFLGEGPGYIGPDDTCFTDMLPADDACTFDDILGTSSKVRVHSDLNEASSAKILIKGYDDSWNWVQTEYPAGSGSYIDGEYVTISTTYLYTTTKFSAITDVIKPITNGPVRLYEYDTVSAGVTRALAFYESDETHPIYRRSKLPAAGNGAGCCGSVVDDTSCEKKTLLVRARLRHIPVRVDNDHLILRNIAALKLMAMAIRKEEEENFEQAETYELKALRELERELATYQGSGEVVPIRMEGMGEPIENLL